MRNLFNFILRHYFFFLFVLIQVICLLLIIQNHTHQRSFFVNSSNRIAGSIYKVHSNITQYFALKKVNEQLSEENNLLWSMIPGSYLKTDQNIFTFRDTLHQRQFSFINARVINNNVRNRNNYLTLDKGRLHGVRPDMGVVTSEGVIGIVKDVSANFSSVISLLHSEMQISAKIQKNDHLGTIIWEGFNPTMVTMLYIPPHVELEKGDTIVTSGFSHIFPEAIAIGVIGDFEVRRGDNFFTLDVELFTDFNNLKYVQVVKNIFSRELHELEILSRTRR
ncbi:MAG: rod shape-determining protein MreC [Bacteroidetes bacterium]|nr:MAG: rod shape-determining protein MreC [Bacteroidota bacterium]